MPKLLPSLGRIVRALDVAMMVDTDVEVEETLARLAVDNYVRSQESMTGPFIFPGIDEIAAALKEDS